MIKKHSGWPIAILLFNVSKQQISADLYRTFINLILLKYTLSTHLRAFTHHARCRVKSGQTWLPHHLLKEWKSWDRRLSCFTETMWLSHYKNESATV